MIDDVGTNSDEGISWCKCKLTRLEPNLMSCEMCVVNSSMIELCLGSSCVHMKWIETLFTLIIINS